MSDETKPTFLERVAVAAPKSGPTKGIFWLLAAPFVVIGFVAGVVYQVGVNAVGALIVGFTDARAQIKSASKAA